MSCFASDTNLNNVKFIKNIKQFVPRITIKEEFPKERLNSVISEVGWKSPLYDNCSEDLVCKLNPNANLRLFLVILMTQDLS